MVRHGARLEQRQGLLGRIVDEAVDLTTMALAISRAASRGDAASRELADLFCRHARARIAAARRLPTRLDLVGARVATRLMAGRYADLERGIVTDGSG
jgi:hypothetical protein